MLKLMAHANRILTDSGGIQKEAYILGVPCITLRDTTEWVETLEGRWNVLVGANAGEILEELFRMKNGLTSRPNIFGEGHAAGKICGIIEVFAQSGV